MQIRHTHTRYVHIHEHIDCVHIHKHYMHNHIRHVHIHMPMKFYHSLVSQLERNTMTLIGDSATIIWWSQLYDKNHMITIIWSTNHMEIKLCFSVITNIIYLIWLTVHWSLIWSYFRQWSLIWSYFRQWSPGSPAAESPNGIPCPAQPEIWIEKYFNSDIVTL